MDLLAVYKLLYCIYIHILGRKIWQIVYHLLAKFVSTVYICSKSKFHFGNIPCIIINVFVTYLCCNMVACNSYSTAIVLDITLRAASILYISQVPMPLGATCPQALILYVSRTYTSGKSILLHNDVQSTLI